MYKPDRRGHEDRTTAISEVAHKFSQAQVPKGKLPGLLPIQLFFEVTAVNADTS